MTRTIVLVRINHVAWLPLEIWAECDEDKYVIAQVHAAMLAGERTILKEWSS